MADKQITAREMDRIFKEKGNGFRFEDFYSGAYPIGHAPPGLKQELNNFFESNHTALSDYIDYRDVNLPAKPITNDPSSYLRQKRMFETSQKNLDTLRLMQQEAMFSSIAGRPRMMPDPNRKYQFDPFTSPKDGTVVNNALANQPELLGYYGTPFKGSGSFNSGISLEAAKTVVEGASSTVRTKNGEIAFQGGQIWRALDKVGASSYSGFSVNAQKHIEDFLAFNDRITKSNQATKHNSFFVYDSETFGSMADGKTLKNDEWFHINEVAIQKYTYDKAAGGHKASETFSWIARPSQNLHQEMLGEIESLKKNPYGFQALSEAKQRSLLDLVKYASGKFNPREEMNLQAAEDITFAPATFSEQGKNRMVVHSNYLNAFKKNGEVNPNAIMANFEAVSEMMKNGLQTLAEQGEDLDVVMGHYNELVERHPTNFFVSYNGDNFDLKALDKFGGKAPKNHLDMLKVFQSVYNNPMQMRHDLNPEAPLEYAEGPWTLNELRRTLGMDTEKAHIGLHDVGDEGLGGITLKARESLLKRVQEASGDMSGDGLQRKSSELSYDPTPVKKGDLFFATSAVINRDEEGSILDFQATVDKKGGVVEMDPSGRVLDAESFYSVMDLKQDREGQQFVLRLRNEDTGAVSHIVRSGPEARAEISQFFQQNLKTADEMIDSGFEALRNTRNTDLARRRYENLLGLNQGYTKGYGAAKRIFGNAEIIRDNFSGDLSNISEADRKALLDLDGVNFNSLYDGGFNKREADQFFEMLPRLASEVDAYKVAFTEIDKAYPEPGRNASYGDRMSQNLVRSLALKRFGAELDVEAGGASMETRKALPYERHILNYQDRISGKDRTLNLRDASTAKDGVLRYIYSEQKDYEGDSATQRRVASERLQTLVLSLQESGYMHRRQASSIIDEIVGNPSVSPAVYGERLAASLAESEDILKRIERDEITYKSMREAEAVKDLDNARVVTAATRAVGFTDRVQGTQIVDSIGDKKEYRPLVTDAMRELFRNVDRIDPLTGLATGNQNAVMDILERFMNQGVLSNRVGYAVSGTKDMSAVHIDIFGDDKMSSALNILESGDRDVPNGAVRVTIPMIGENGTMKYGDMVVNAKSYVVKEGSEYRKISSVQRLADEFDDRTIQGILRGVHDHTDRDKAQQMAKSTTYDGVKMLAGSKRNVGTGENDTMFFKNNRSDIVKQSYIDVAPAMIRDLYESGELEKLGGVKEYLKDSAFDREGDLKKYLNYDEDIKVEMKELISRTGLQWALDNEELIGGKVDLSGVKDDKAWNHVAFLNLREALPEGGRGPHTRSNLVQKANSYDFDPEMQDKFNRAMSAVDEEDRLAYSFDRLVTTALDDQIAERLPDGSVTDINMKVGLITEADLQKRMFEMSKNAEDRQLLIDEGILEQGEDGYRWNAARTPSVYEQQTIMNREALDNFWVNRSAFYDVDREKNLQVAENLIDEATGNLRDGALVREGEIIGYEHDGTPVRFTKAGEGRIVETGDGRIRIDYTEKAHKFVTDIEKGTPSAGKGFSRQFMERVSGIEGVGMLIGPDIEKHGDTHHILSGQYGRIALELNKLEGDEFEEKKAMIEDAFRGEDGRAGLRVVDRGGYHAIEVDTIGAGYTGSISDNVLKLMDNMGLKETADTVINGNRYQTVELFQGVSIADVSDYSSAAGDEERNVKYGPRELDMLRRQGLHETADYVEGLISDAANEVRLGGSVSAEMTRQGMMDSLRNFAGRIAPDETERVFTVDDFRESPIADRNTATYQRTILDTDYIKKEAVHIPGQTREGFWFQLPELDDDLAIRVEGQRLNQVFIPYEDLQTKGNDVQRTKTQIMNESLINRARAVEAAKQPDEHGRVNHKTLETARNSLQSTVEEMRQRLVYDLTSSKGFVGKNVMSAKLPNSADGIAKIISPEFEFNPEMKEGNADNVLYVSRADARNMGVLDKLENGEDFFAPLLRNPTFHEDAIQIAKVELSEDLEEGQQKFSSLQASKLRADSDGDSTRATMLIQDGVQDELAAKWARQNEEDLAEILRADEKFRNAVGGAVSELHLAEKDHRAYGEERLVDDAWQKYSLSNIGTAYVDPSDQSVQINEQRSKFGRALVGQASNLNYRYSHLAMQFLDTNNEQEARMADAVGAFFSGRQGIEQKIISAKHGQNGGVELVTRNGALQMIQALQRGQFDQAAQIDQDFLDGQFTNNARMQEAMEALRLINERADQRNNLSRNMGLSSGVTRGRSDELLDMLEGNAENVSHGNQFYVRSVELNGGVVENDYIYDDKAERPEYIERRINPEPEAPNHYYTTGAPRPPVDSPIDTVGGYVEPRRIRDYFPNAGLVGKGILAASAVGAGALMLTNLTKADKLTPENAPYNDPVINDSQPDEQIRLPKMLDHEGNIRVEMNGEGYSGVNVRVRGQGDGRIGPEQIGNIAGGALTSAGIPANVNVRAQDDTTTYDQQWMQNQFLTLMEKGSV